MENNKAKVVVIQESSIEHLLTSQDTLILGHFNAHHPSWYSRSTDTRGRRRGDLGGGVDVLVCYGCVA